MLQMMSTGAARRILLSLHPALVRGKKEGCDRGSEIGTVHNKQDGEGPVSLRKPKKSGRRQSCEKGFVFMKYSGYVFSLQRPRLVS